MLRNVLDPFSVKNQVAQLQRERHYDDDLQHYDCPHPSNAPRWSYLDQSGVTYDTDWERNEDYEEEELQDVGHSDGYAEEVNI